MGREQNKEKNENKENRYPGVRPWKLPGTYRIDYYDHRGVHRTRIFRGPKADAARLRTKLLAEEDRIKHGLEPPPEATTPPITLQELWERFYDDNQLRVKSGSMKQKSLDRYRNTVDALFDYDPSLRNKRIVEVSGRDFEQFKIHRRTEGFSPDGINTNLRNLRTIFNYGISNDLLKHSPLSRVSYIRTPQQDVRFLNEEELKRLHLSLGTLDLGERFQRDARDLVLFYLYTGARTSEALYPQFTWGCIGVNKIHFPTTKTYQGRSIPLTRKVREVLEERNDITGGPFHFTVYTVYNRTKFAFKKAGLEDISTHNLRKTAGAYYYMATRDIFATSRFLGHSSVNVTEKHYVGLIQSLQTQYADEFDRTLTDVLENGPHSVR